MVKKFILSTLIIISIPLFIILLNINSTFYNEIEEHQDLDDFFNQDQPLSDDYTEKEKTHLQEIKDLLAKSSYIVSITFILITLSSLFLVKIEKTKLLNSISTGTTLTLIITLIFIFLSTIDFSNFFTGFHILTFETNNWLLDSSTKLIQTFPLTYFQEIIQNLLTVIVFQAIALILILKILKKGIKNNFN